jgi:hypothetical protein
MTKLEEFLVHLGHLDEQCRDAILSNESHKKCVKSQYDKSFHPRVFFKGDLVLVYDQDKDALGGRKLNPLWRSPYIIRRVLRKGSYELADYEGMCF